MGTTASVANPRMRYEKRHCLVCDAAFYVRGNKGDKNRRYCSKSCAAKAVHARHKAEGRGPRYIGSTKPELRPTVPFTFQDIHFAAGLYEGEGSCGTWRGGDSIGVQVHMCQKDPEVLYWIRDRFGGKVTYRPPRNGRNEVYDWQVSGSCARFFLKGMYPLMSERRKRQIEKIFNWPEQPVKPADVDLDASGDATERFREQDIYWAAGIYEGEGSCQAPDGYGCSVRVAQKEPEILYKLRDLFGGTTKPRKQGIHEWCVHGPRARCFIKAMYPMLSVRRKGQVDQVMGWSA